LAEELNLTRRGEAQVKIAGHKRVERENGKER